VIDDESTKLAIVKIGEETKRDALDEANQLTQWASLTSNAIEVLPLETSADEELAAKLARELREAKRRSDAARDKLVAPFKAVVAEIDAVFKSARVEIDKLDARLRTRLAEASADRRRRQELADREARAAAEEAERALQRAALASSPAAVAKAEAAARESLDVVRESLATSRAVEAEAPKGVHVRTSWTWEVEAIDKVPRHLLTVDPAAMRAFLAAVKTSPEPPEVPGIRWVKKETTVIR
jgi:hypothetical protein